MQTIKDLNLVSTTENFIKIVEDIERLVSNFSQTLAGLSFFLK